MDFKEDLKNSGQHLLELPGVCHESKPPPEVLKVLDALHQDGLQLTYGDMPPKFLNRLALESSPYLQQHATNPVNWFPWGEEALALAKKQDKPIFLSIGYSTCHWCHVMAHESFENEEIAAYLNEHFIPIKVDREERPDVDAVYMAGVLALSGHGGWPLSAWLLPDTKPFYGGTYFPPKDHYRGNRAGFLSVLQQLNQVYTQNRAHVTAAAEDLTQAIQRQMSPHAPAQTGHQTMAEHRTQGVSSQIIRTAMETYDRQFDPVNGGLRGAPKFPSSFPSAFITRMIHMNNNVQAGQIWQERIEKTLLHITRGGLYDHVAGGFHRYTVDEEWHVPHFEKMLYDQANILKQLVCFYLQARQKSWFKETIDRTITFLRQELTDERGYFYAALDADSRDALEGSDTYGEMLEGAYYTWSWSQLTAVLTDAELHSLTPTFDLSVEGNFEHRNIFYYHDKEGSVSDDRAATIAILQKLNEQRLTRPRPLTDIKLIVGWNALMISSLVKASLIFDKITGENILADAQRCLDFIQKQCLLPDGRLCRIYSGQHSKQAAFFEDYLYLAVAYFEIFQVQQNRKHLQSCMDLIDTSIQLFWNNHGQCFMNASVATNQLLANDANLYDQVLPSPNALALQLLLALHELTQNSTYNDLVEQLALRYKFIFESHPTASPEGLLGLHAYETEPILVTVYDHEEGAMWQQCRELMQEFSWPLVIWLHATPRNLATIQALPPTGDLLAGSLKEAIVLCHNGTCTEPVKQVDQLRDKLYDLLTI